MSTSGNDTNQQSGITVLSRDEMNLAEFPLTVLSSRSSPNIKTLEFSDSIRLKDGQQITRSWIITGADKFGLPTASDDEVLIGLLKLTLDKNFENRRVYFTRYELLKALQWTTEGRSYSRLQKALDRLSGVRIKATNAFYDNALKTHSTRNFGIIDAYEINDNKESGSYFIWSDALYKSFQTGFIKKIDLSFYLTLNSAVSKRIYRYLDKNFWYRSKISMNLFSFAHDKIGVSRTVKYASSIRQQLDPALDELVARGFLSCYDYRGTGKHMELVVFAAETKKLSEHEKPKLVSKLDNNILNMLLARGIREPQAKSVLSDATADILTRIEKIIKHFDYLVSTNSRHVSKNPAGFLFSAVSDPFAFNLPSDKNSAQTNIKQMKVKGSSERPSVKTAGKVVDSDLQVAYLKYWQGEVQRIRKEDVDEHLLKKLQSELVQALAKIRAHVSEQRFNEVVELGVNEKLAKLYAVPTFEEWKQENK